MDEHSLLALRERIGDEHLGQRMRAQVDLMTQLMGRGYGSFHYENVSLFVHAIRLALRVTGLYRRGQRNALAFSVHENPVLMPDLPAPFAGLRILHLSDLHLDGYLGLGQHIARAVSGLAFDVCVLTGDFRFFDTGRYAHIATELEALVPALACRFGVYGILGNHDFIEMVPLLEAKGIRMLLNEAVALTADGASLWLVGLDDAHLYGMHNFEKGLRDVPPDAPRILLAHSPEVIAEASKRGFSLYLTGHTHGGQICLPGGHPLLLNARCPRRYAVGGPWQFQRMAGYTSRGTGSSGVFTRFFCPPEIVVHVLKREIRNPKS